MTEKMRKTIRENLSIIATIAVFIAGISGFTWGAVLRPLVNSEIDKRVIPIVDLLTYHSFIFEAQLDSTMAQAVADRYLRWKRGPGMLK